MQTFKKVDDKNIEVSESQLKKREIISYDRILNDIQETEKKLIKLQELKKEADKLKLTR